MDLYLLPLIRENGQVQPDLPGLYVPPQPRRLARNRRTDRLIVYLSFLAGSLAEKERTRLMDRLGHTFYQTAGSLTSAMRAAAENLNSHLVQLNHRQGAGGELVVAVAGFLARRDGQIYLALCGPMQVSRITRLSVNHYADPQATRRGLGLGQALPIYYAQLDLEPGDALVLSPNPPAAWSEAALQPAHGQRLENLHRHLLNLSGPNVQALLVQSQAGSGEIHTLRAKPLARPVSPDLAPPAVPSTEPQTAPPAVPSPEPQPAPPAADFLPAGREVQPPPTPQPVPVGRPPRTAGDYPPAQAEGMPSAERLAAVGEATPEKQAAPHAPRRSLAPGKTVATLFRALGVTWEQFQRSTGTLLRRVLPNEQTFDLPPGVMAFVALAVPLVVVAVAAVIYFQSGRAGQYRFYYAQADQAAVVARAQTDPQASRQAWETVLAQLDLAAQYRGSQQSDPLSQEAQRALDELDLALRLDYQPAITGGLPAASLITRILTAESEIYLLDSQAGQVYRAFSTGRGYELDSTFQCGPGYSGSMGIGPLVDIVPLPKSAGGEFTVLGMDAAGNLLHCQQGPPLFNLLAPPPQGWTSPSAMAIAQGNLYVLDAGANAVWIYWNSDLTQQPDLFFDDEIPPLADVADLAVDRGELMLLHADGHLTQCSYSDLEVSPTRCTDPAPYIDGRPWNQGLPVTPLPGYTQLIITQPPDPSLYLLEGRNQAVHHFSLRLTYQRQLRPVQTLQPVAPQVETGATALAFTPDNRVVFLAIGNVLYYAGVP